MKQRGRASFGAAAAGLASLLLPATVLGQIVPDAGSTLRDFEKPALELPKKPPPAPAVEQPARPALEPAPAVRFTLRAFRITGSTAFAESELAPLVAEFVGREVGYAELEQAAARLTRFYREKGYPVARAYLPAQDIRDGVVEIAVLEGRFGKVEIQNRSRVRDSVAVSHLQPLQGRLIEERGFERKLLLLYDLPGVGEPKATLRPGANVGESDLAVELGGRPLATGSVEFDNYGNRFTGGNRISGQANLLSPLGLGDLLGLRATRGDPGLDYARLAYQLPLGAGGLKLGASFARTEYRLGKQFAVLDASGHADVWGGYLSYPFIRTRAFNLYGQAGYEQRDLEDRVGATSTVTSKRLGVSTLTLLGDARDGVLGGGVNVFSLSYANGSVDIRSPVARAIDDATVRTQGDYDRWNLSLLRLQTVTGNLSLLLSYTAQKAGKNLDSSEKFVLGGPTAVRAYPVGEAAADTGSVLSAELRYDIRGTFPGTLQPFGFVDTGEAKINEQPVLAGGNKRRLSSVGAGLNWFRAGDFTVRLVYAHKLGNARATSDTDRDSRGWVQLIKYF